MTAEPTCASPAPVTGSYEMIHLGGQSAVVVPLADFMRLRALEQVADQSQREDAEDAAALQEWKARKAAGEVTYVSADEVRHRLGLST